MAIGAVPWPAACLCLALEAEFLTVGWIQPTDFPVVS
ncbi:MAG: hypothetical protein H6R40_964, partial [Gemmatimonadetes bacterium]|nr:hypothetical protein [Gemmatimonadota bacterium]